MSNGTSILNLFHSTRKIIFHYSSITKRLRSSNLRLIFLPQQHTCKVGSFIHHPALRDTNNLAKAADIRNKSLKPHLLIVFVLPRFCSSTTCVKLLLCFSSALSNFHITCTYHSAASVVLVINTAVMKDSLWFMFDSR